MPALGTPLYAQLRVIGQPNTVASYAKVNVFLQYEARESVSGLLLDMPPGWKWISGAKRSERGAFTSLKYELTSEGRIRIVGTNPFKFGDAVLLQLQAGGSEIKSSISVSPFVFQGSTILLRNAVRVDIFPEPKGKPRSLNPQQSIAENKVGSFGPKETEGWTIDLPSNKALASNEPYTVTMWVQTTETNQILMSTWSGVDSDDYPLEWVVDPAGFLEFYRGFGSKHVSMRSKKPISDGNWHFIGLVHDPVNEWTKLAVDGVVEDSLYHIYSFPNRTADKLALGTRLSQNIQPAISSLTGFIDDVRVSSTAWRSDQIASEMTHPSNDDSFVLDFQSGLVSGLVVETKRIDRGRTDLEVSIELKDDVVVLEWESLDPTVRSYVVERSWDGQQFESVSDIRAIPSTSSGVLSYTDVVQFDGVVFYRIIPFYEAGPGQSSPVLKIGRGDVEPTFTATLAGNFPNPFNPSTTISYDVLETQHVRISVWDLSGQMLTVLADVTQSAGHYEVPYTANDLPSGTYFVRMESDSGIQTHQILLMK